MNTILHFKTLNSTQIYAKEHVKKYTQNTLILTDEQTEGIGRRGQKWIGSSSNFMGTFVFKNFAPTPPFIGQLAFVMAVGIGRFFKHFNFTDFSFKWPNDIYDKNFQNKIAGILIEIDGDDLLVGVGVNKNIIPSLGNKTYKASSLKDLNANELLARWSNELFFTLLENTLDDYKTNGFTAYKNEWMQHCAHVNKTIKMYDDKSGIFIGIDDFGNYLF